MSVPRLTEVFLIEASMRAYQMIGWSRPAAKAWFEKTYGPVALEVAIMMMALINDEDDDLGVEGITDTVEFPRYVNLLKKSSKFRDMIKKHSKELLSLKDQEDGYVKAWGALDKMAQTFMTEPEEYKGETALELEDGWKWVQLTEEDCRDYEGQQMQHCGRASGMMFSLRDPQGKPHVTMDVSPSGGVDDGPLNIPPNDIIQLRGKQNDIPDFKYWPKIKELVQQVGAKALWDSYADPKFPGASDAAAKISRKIAEFMELEWAHDPDNHPEEQDQEEFIGDAGDMELGEPTPLDDYQF